MAQHSNYWSCSKFADWVRGTPKLSCGTSEEWEAWHELAEKKAIRYWIAEEMLGDIQDFVTWPVRKLYDIKYYINNRYITRTHSLTASPMDIKPGTWMDVGNRFLPCMFNELCNFIEVEQAWHHIAWGSKEDKAKYNAPFWATGWFRWRTWRCPQAGLDHLAWEMTLVHDDEWTKDEDYYMKPTSQAIKATELRALYDWWTVTRPSRPDPYEASGWTALCEEGRAKRKAEGKRESFLAGLGNRTPEEEDYSRKVLDALHKMEAEYEQEDEDMMIRLIKVRNGLWT